MLIFNYSKAMAQVTELRRISDDMTNTNNRNLTEAINGLQSGWQGQTSQLFVRKCNELKELIAKEVANIRKVADSLETSARAIEAAERAAAELAARQAAAAAAAATAAAKNKLTAVKK